MVATSVLAFWAAALFVGPTPVGPKPDRERDLLRGPVKTVACEFTPGFRSAVTCRVFRATYGRDGWLAEQVVPDNDGSPSQRTVFHGNRMTDTIESVTVNLRTGDTTTTTTRIIRDATRRTLTFETIDPSLPAGRYVAETERYDSVGNLIESTGYYWNPPGSVRHRSRFVYDDQDRIVKAIEWDPHGPDKATVLYKYDATGQVAEETWFSEDGTLRGTTRFKYKLDSHGNWLERTSQLCSPKTRPDGELVCDAPLTEKRTITYYKGGR
jgi:hypothetical protein